ncbi:cytochrome c peroxidase [Chitinophaga sp. YR573]|uniref:cytochrome-c peroxidase n=1 Tax=Chitinophaga sp. YR573 TaxID=1881040 RepID=UPI0008B67269|nr:cytochrome c peroxidase [Chitinophaga sp. YR573]SEW39807.1 cytochrome c peroxidase [Chitinophaga sp. YR573]
MKIVLPILLLVVTCMAQLSFYPSFSKAEELAATYANDFRKTTIELEEIASAYKFNQVSQDTLRAMLVRTRNAYKKIEFLLAYYYPEYVDEHINGAPVLHIKRNDSRAVVIEPQGLQVLDELINSSSPDKIKIATLAQQLKTNYGVLLTGFSTRKFNTQEWCSAIRLQLVRIFSLGLTGFDTPGSLNAMEEAARSLSGIREITVTFLQEDETVQLLDSAITYLQQPVSFNDFDRFVFLQKYINPLYTHYYVYADNNTGWNSASKNIFSEDFLNPYYYTELRKEEDNKTLRSLGRKLFYDPMLSSNNKLSCASCHNPRMAFTDGQDKSASIVKDHPVLRNAPTLLNAVYADRYFYDLRAFSLEQQAEHVIFNQQEFNTAYEEILKKLSDNPQYKQQFKECFGRGAITRNQFSKALSSYVLSLRSFNSTFDKYVRGESDTTDITVIKGFNLFMGKANCGTCHFAPTFSGLVPPLYIESESETLGVLQDPDHSTVDTDNGRLDNQLYSEMAWINEKSFKTTTVRNAALTAPYFHNGAYKTLEQVIDFYDHGGAGGKGIHIKNQTLSTDSLHLSATEKHALIAFIGALSDTSILVQ